MDRARCRRGRISDRICLSVAVGHPWAETPDKVARPVRARPGPRGANCKNETGRARKHPDVAHKMVADRASETRKSFEEALNLPAALLLSGDGASVFPEVDRLKAERELRLVVVPPLFALAILLACNHQCWWALVLSVITLFLFVQAHTRNRQYKVSDDRNGAEGFRARGKFRRIQRMGNVLPSVINRRAGRLGYAGGKLTR